ncbi:MAG: hypothetical protein ABI781_18915, partial [Burkholderiales bacterium]
SRPQADSGEGQLAGIESHRARGSLRQRRLLLPVSSMKPTSTNEVTSDPCARRLASEGARPFGVTLSVLE